jgi:hypothetical protein
MRKASSIRKQLHQIIRQGNNEEILELFKEIVKASQEEFTEDNLPTQVGFLSENLFNSFSAEDIHTSECIKNVMVKSVEDAHFFNNRC